MSKALQNALIHGQRVATPEGIGPASVGVTDGKIVYVGPDRGAAEPAGEYIEIDAEDLLVMPGGVDVHTHLQLEVGGIVTADNWGSGSRAALWGGTTTVVDFAEYGASRQGANMLQALTARTELAVAQGCLVDFGLHMTVTDTQPETLEAMGQVVAAGQPTFKIYTAYPGRLMLEEGQITKVLARAAELGARVWVHAEDGWSIHSAVEATIDLGETRARDHANTRPPASEVYAVSRVLGAAEETGAAVHFAHLSAGGSIADVHRARERGVKVTAETCPQYLWLEQHRLDWEAPAGLCQICSPPLRPVAHLDAIRRAVAAGKFEAMATDHCPFNWHGGKERGLAPVIEVTAEGQLIETGEMGEDFTRVPGGLPGVESRLPLTFAAGPGSQSPAYDYDLERFVELIATGPAKVAGLYPTKGAIAVGADADLVLFDPEDYTSLDCEALHMNVDHSPYEGLRAQGRVVAVFRAGALVVADGVWQNDPPPGRLVERQPTG